MALTRARHHLVVLGCSSVLRTCSAAFRLLLEGCPLSPALGGLPLRHTEPAGHAVRAEPAQSPVQAMPSQPSGPSQADGSAGQAAPARVSLSPESVQPVVDCEVSRPDARRQQDSAKQLSPNGSHDESMSSPGEQSMKHLFDVATHCFVKFSAEHCKGKCLVKPRSLTGTLVPCLVCMFSQ